MRLVLVTIFAMGCSAGGRAHLDGGGNGSDGGTGGGADLAGMQGGDDAGQSGCGELQNCYTVYAHSDHVLYHIDLANKALVEVGPFNAPKMNGNEDVITDIAVSDSDEIYAISHTTLYTADANDGHVTVVGPVTDCGMDNVALTFTPDGKLWAADYKGAFCNIDLSTNPPTVKQIATLGNNMAVSGDLVAVADGTMFATIYSLSNSSTQTNNMLAKIDPTTGQITQQLGSTGFPKLFGVAFDNGQVFAFTHDGSGDVITVDPKTGKGTLYNTFMDPMTGKGISFAGAGVNAMVPAPPIG